MSVCVREININSSAILSALSNKNPRDRVTSVMERTTEREWRHENDKNLQCPLTHLISTSAFDRTALNITRLSLFGIVDELNVECL